MKVEGAKAFGGDRVQGQTLRGGIHALTGGPMDSFTLHHVRIQREAASLHFWWGLT